MSPYCQSHYPFIRDFPGTLESAGLQLGPPPPPVLWLLVKYVFLNVPLSFLPPNYPCHSTEEGQSNNPNQRPGLFLFLHQPRTLSRTGNKCQPKDSKALQLGSKGRCGSFHLWMHVDGRCHSSLTHTIPECLREESSWWCAVEINDNYYSQTPNERGIALFMPALWSLYQLSTNNNHTHGWQHGIVVALLGISTKLLYIRPTDGYIICVCNQPTRSTQPCIYPNSLNQVPALLG